MASRVETLWRTSAADEWLGTIGKRMGERHRQQQGKHAKVTRPNTSHPRKVRADTCVVVRARRWSAPRKAMQQGCERARRSRGGRTTQVLRRGEARAALGSLARAPR
eukprot:6188926-Pleurochrysis_carterae.AAC.2